MVQGESTYRPLAPSGAIASGYFMEKLVRDRIPEFSADKSDGRKFRVADPSEMPHLLIHKLCEEIGEVSVEIARKDKDKLTEELADVLEVVSTIREHFGISMDELDRARADKYKKKGAFYSRVVLDLKSQV